MIPRRIDMQLATHETEQWLRKTDLLSRGPHARFDDLDVYTSSRIRDGDVLACPSGFLVVGTRKDYVNTTIRRITREVFDQEFLEKIGMLEPTGNEVLHFCHFRANERRARRRLMGMPGEDTRWW